MRIIRPEPDLNTWQRAGWTRKPRNSHELEMVRQGKPQPQERDKPWKFPYKCRVHGPGVRYKVVDNGGKRARRCLICMKNRWVRYDTIHREENRERKTRLTREARNAKPIFEDGFATVTGTWLKYNVSAVEDYVKHGALVVEILGIPSYKIVRLR